MQAKYDAAGYKLPQVVFWNLRASSIRGQKSTPVQFNERGVALVSGFSGQLLKLFMDQPGDVEAWKVGRSGNDRLLQMHDAGAVVVAVAAAQSPPSAPWPRYFESTRMLRVDAWHDGLPLPSIPNCLCCHSKCCMPSNMLEGALPAAGGDVA